MFYLHRSMQNRSPHETCFSHWGQAVATGKLFAGKGFPTSFRMSSIQRAGKSKDSTTLVPLVASAGSSTRLTCPFICDYLLLSTYNQLLLNLSYVQHCFRSTMEKLRRLNSERPTLDIVCISLGQPALSSEPWCFWAKDQHPPAAPGMSCLRGKKKHIEGKARVGPT